VTVGGYLVRFGSADDPDLTDAKDFFTPRTDYATSAWPAKSHVYFNHRQPVKGRAIKQRFTNDAELSIDEIGVFAKHVLDERDEYERMVADLARAGKLGWSSGTAAHLTDRKDTKNGTHEITRWPLGLDASYTHTPAEYRNQVLPLKSVIPPLAAGAAGDSTQIKTSKMENIMEIDETKLQEMIAAAAKSGAEAAIAALPPLKSVGVAVSEPAVTHDEADNPFTSIADNLFAVKNWQLSGGQVVHPRLKAIKAVLGGNEATPSEGGYLLEPTIAAQLLMDTHEAGPFTSAVFGLPVGTDSNYGWINGVDETSRADGSRWGGIRGYRLAEAAEKTASQPKFRRINWELKKYAVLVYGTDELLKDSAQFSTIVRMGCSEELSFMTNDDIFGGNGTGGPRGFTQSGAFISVAKETGQAADTVVYQNLIKMWARLRTRSKSKAVWYISPDVGPQLDQLYLAAGTSGIPPRFVDYDAQGVMRIKGRPVVETEYNPVVGDLGDIVLADMSQYLFWEKGGVEAAQSIHVQFLTDQTVFRFVYRCDGQTAHASAITPNNGGATQSAFVGLAAR